MGEKDKANLSLRICVEKDKRNLSILFESRSTLSLTLPKKITIGKVSNLWKVAIGLMCEVFEDAIYFHTFWVKVMMMKMMRLRVDNFKHKLLLLPPSRADEDEQCIDEINYRRVKVTSYFTN